MSLIGRVPSLRGWRAEFLLTVPPSLTFTFFTFQARIALAGYWTAGSTLDVD